MKLFVYGSLREGFYNWEIYLKGKSTKAEKATCMGTLCHQTNKGYPAMIQGTGTVHGELVTLLDFENNIISIDTMENYKEDNPNNEYIRTILPIKNEETKKIEEAFVYLYAREDLFSDKNPCIPLSHGDWAKYKKDSH